jgi:hypothetical protein
MISEANAFELASIMHPTCANKAHRFPNMVLILLSIIVAAIAVAISIIQSSSGSLAGSGIVRMEIARAREKGGQPHDYRSDKAILGRGVTRREDCESSRSGPSLAG